MQSPQNTDDEWPRCLAPENFRLPSKINPIHYDLTLEPHFEKAAYSGNVIIQLEVLEEAGEVTLHSENLIIVSAFIEGPDRKYTYYSQLCCFYYRANTVSQQSYPIPEERKGRHD